MTFLTPFFLWLIPLSVIPLAIHLLNRRNVVTIDFSTLRFLKLIEKESINKINLLQIILLILRMLLILLIILMISRPVINNSAINPGNTALQVIMLDDSFSMMAHEKEMENQAKMILNQINDKSELLWINANGGVQFFGLKGDLEKMKDLIKTTYLPESFDKAFETMNDYEFDKHLQKDIYFITDKQHESLRKINANMEKTNNAKAYVFTTSTLESNLAILHAKILNDVIVPNEPFEIEATLMNTGTEDMTDHNVQLIINDLAVGQQVVSLTPGEEKQIRFTTSIPGPGSYAGGIYSQSDDRNKDNACHFNLKVPKEINIAFLNIGNENSQYLSESIAVLNKNSNFYDMTSYNLSDLSSEIVKILKNDLIITTPATIANHSNSDFMEFVYNGGHLLIFPNDKTTIDEYKSMISEFTETNAEMNELKLIELLDAHQEINPASIVPKQMRNLLSSDENNDRIIKFFNFHDLPFFPKATQMRLRDKSSIWNRHVIGDGLIDIFSFSMNLKWTNFPIKGSFLPLIHYLTHSSSKFNNNDGMLVNERWSIPLKQHVPNKTMHELPNDKSEILNDFKNGKITTNQLRIPGQHKITMGNRVVDQIAVNLNESEFEQDLSDDDYFSLKMSSNLSLINNDKNIEEQLDIFRNGRELWRLLLYAIVIILMIEMYLSSPLKKN